MTRAQDNSFASNETSIRNTTLNKEPLSQGETLVTGFSSTIYTGNGTTNAITTGVDMSTGDNGGLVWAKQRSAGAVDHDLIDSVRGTSATLFSSTTAAESVDSRLTSFDSSGFTTGTTGSPNTNTETYVAWSWQTTKKDAPTYGSNLLTGDDTNFTTTVGNWTGGTGDTLSVVSNALKVNSDDGNLAQADVTITTTVGESYLLEVDVVEEAIVSAGRDITLRCVETADVATRTDVGHLQITFVATATSHTISLGVDALNTNDYCRFDDVIAREITAGTKTNRGKATTIHSNADMGFSIVGYEGDGVDGHEIPHGLGTAPELTIFKNRDSGLNGWPVQGAYIGDSAAGNQLVLQSSDALNVGNSTYSTIFTDATLKVGSNADYNSSGDNFISYHFRSTPGVSKIGTYIGTGTAGNYVDCGFGTDGAGFVMIKNLSSVAEWVVLDSIRGGGVYLEPSTSDAEASVTALEFSEGGFVIVDAGTTRNTLNDEYLFMAFVESSIDGTKAETDYTQPTTQDTLTIENGALVSLAEGFNANGQIDTQYEFGAGKTHVLGAGNESQHLYVYTDKTGTIGTTENRPLVGFSSRDDADKWGVVSPLDASLRTTAKHFDYESETGVALASGETGTSTEAWMAFDQGLAQAWQITATGASWLQYKQTEKRILKSWRMRESGSITATPDNFTIEGSDDGLVWDIIDSTYSVTDYDTVANGANLWGPLHSTSGQTTPYLYHRMNVTVNNGHGTVTELSELEFNTILPSDYYLIQDGKMYEPTIANLLTGTNSTFDGDLGTWAAGDGGSGLSGVANRLRVTNNDATRAFATQSVSTTAGESYTFSVEVVQGTAAGVNIGIGTVLATGDIHVETGYTASDTFSITFTAAGATTYLYLENDSTTSSHYSDFDNVTVEWIYDAEVDRTYLGECKTDIDGDIIEGSIVNYVARQHMGEVEVQGDLTVHGDIISKTSMTARVRFDAAENPPIIETVSGPILDIVDVGTGQYDVVVSNDVNFYTATWSVNKEDTFKNISTGIVDPHRLRVVVRSDSGTYGDSRVCVNIFGGKEIK